jgi:hypothetical protein
MKPRTDAQLKNIHNSISKKSYTFLTTRDWVKKTFQYWSYRTPPEIQIL